MTSHFLKILSVVFPVFCIIGLGFFFARFKKLSLEPIVEVLLYLTIPALVISSLSKKQLVVSDLVTVSIAALIVVLGTGGLAWVYLAVIKRRDLRGFYLPTMFMNSGNMSFPLAILAFGSAGLTVAVLYYLAISLLVYSLGIYIAKGRDGFAEMFKLPLIYASVIGIALNLADIHLPGPVVNTVDMLGAATIPMMQISLGYRLHSAQMKDAGISIAGSLIRIVGGFLIAWGAVELMGIEGLNRKIILLSSTMPSAAINFVVSHKYKLQSDLVASIVAMSTALSIVSTTALLLWIMD
ncbi:MAG: AEC family transporter [Deltaproteobacteria bacterium]|nr:AEC family transporter [Deltaproteobacteria bacterium]